MRYLFLILFTLTSLFAGGQTSTNKNDNFCGDPIVQTGNYVFHCPERKGYKVLLKNFSYNSPNYTCVYMQNGQVVHSCNYVSEDVQDALRDADVKFNSALGFMSVTGDVKQAVKSLQSSDIFTADEKAKLNLTQFLNNLEKVEYNQDHGNDKIAAEDYKLINKYLIDAHQNPNTETQYTFSRFLIGLITLSPDVVSGYNSVNGQIKINQKWITNTVNFRAYQTGMQEFKQTVHSIMQVLHEMNPFASHKNADSTLQNIKLTGNYTSLDMSGWYKIFDLKLWGFYYDFMSKMDKAVRYMLMILFALVMTYGGSKIFFTSGVSYYLSRDELNFKNPNTIINTSVIILTIGLFFLSPSTKNENNNVSFYTNDTVAKIAIRQFLFTGDKIATMTNDFATAAYLDYVLHKEDIANPVGVFQESLIDLKKIYIFKELEPQLKACLAYYNYAGNIQQFLGDTLQDLQMSDPNIYYKTPYYKLTGADEISYNSCINMAKNYEITKNMVLTDTIALNKELRNYEKNVPLAMKFYVMAQIEINRRYGWVSMITVPVNYFIATNADLFIDNGISQSVIEQIATNDIKSLKFKNPSEANKYYGSGSSDVKVLTSTAAGVGLGYFTDVMSHFILPYFGTYYMAIYKGLSKALAYQASDKNTISRNAKAFALKLARKMGRITGVLAAKLFSLVNFKMIIIAIAAFFIALFFWKLTFKILFIVTFSLFVLFEIVFYFKDVLIYFMMSVFIPIWAMQKQGGQKIEKFLGEGIGLMFKPVVLVFVVYLAIFIMGLFEAVYYFLLTVMFSVGKTLIQYLIVATNNGITGFVGGVDGIMFIESIKDVGDIVALLVQYAIGILIVYKGVEIIMKKFGYQEEGIFTHAVQKTEKYVNPI